MEMFSLESLGISGVIEVFWTYTKNLKNMPAENKSESDTLSMS